MGYLVTPYTSLHFAPVSPNFQICFPAPYLNLHAKYSHRMPNMPRGRTSPGLPYSVSSGFTEASLACFLGDVTMISDSLVHAFFGADLPRFQDGTCNSVFMVPVAASACLLCLRLRLYGISLRWSGLFITKRIPYCYHSIGKS